MSGRRCKSGRAARKRRRKHRRNVQSVSLCHQAAYVRLMKFLQRREFASSWLQPAVFTDTGRGLQALRTIKPDQLIISLPESCLLTTSTVLESYLGLYIRRWKQRLPPLLVLCVFLVCERHRGDASDWFPYIHLLPHTYTCPAYFTDDVMEVLPPCMKRRALEQREAVWEMHSSNQDFFQSLQPLLSEPAEDVLTYEALRWAWCSVNTRSVFMSQPPNDFLSGPDNYALAPFLDLLNHRPDVQVKAGFNKESRCYEIRSVCGTRRYQQVFINYGSHDNQRLLLEYGFVAPDNPHSVVYVETALLCDALHRDTSLDQKLKFLKENNFLHQQWKAVLLGQAVSEEQEEWSLQTASALCQRLTHDAHTALDKISHLLRQCDQPIREQQLNVVKALRQEERCILGSCTEALGRVKEESDDGEALR
ncbi:SET domain-containing protein 4 isoform X2 [Gouania willdenowi]|uniref:SET domain-containing protein 4 isoform X2 n=1 Tax=Gouania willdenowi TaxID=441366 RepID=UPI0010541A30|nr:SET domain-containing protein 4 isoform X2 [Gouania willdenowi]